MRFNLSELEAFDAMRLFLEAYWRRGGQVSDDLASLLSDIGREVWANAQPGDPAQWDDWLAAVEAIKGNGRN